MVRLEVRIVRRRGLEPDAHGLARQSLAGPVLRAGRRLGVTERDEEEPEIDVVPEPWFRLGAHREAVLREPTVERARVRRGEDGHVEAPDALLREHLDLRIQVATRR